MLFDQIPLDKVSTSMTINAPAAILLAMYVAVARRQGVEIKDLRGTIQNDILKEYIARGTYIFPPAHSMRLVTDVFRYCQQEIPHWNTISISGYHIREAGSTAVQEVAFTLANAIAYVQAAIQVGLDVDEFAGQLSFFFNAHNNFMEEVAKFRAARRLWARLMRDRFAARQASSIMMRFHTQTGGSNSYSPTAGKQCCRAFPPGTCQPSSEGRNPCIRTAWTKLYGCLPKNQSGLPCALSRSLLTNPAWQIPLTLLQALT